MKVPLALLLAALTVAVSITSQEPAPAQVSHRLFIPALSRDAGGAVPPSATPYILELGPGVPAADAQQIEAGFAMARSLADDELGGDIPDSVLKTVTVKIVADGKGNQERGGGGSCCTAFSESVGGGMRPFFDILHSNWQAQAAPEQRKVAAHEYFHGWQGWLGCISQFDRGFGDWHTEGTAEYLAYRALAAAGEISEAEADALVRSRAINAGLTQYSLAQLREPPTWPGHLGYFAVKELVEGSPHGVLSLRILCEHKKSGQPLDDAFALAFGVNRDAFEASFELELPPAPLSGTIASASGKPATAYFITACPVQGGDCSGASVGADGTFRLDVSPGAYYLGINAAPPVPGAGPIGWYVPGGSVPATQGATAVTVGGEPVTVAITAP